MATIRILPAGASGATAIEHRLIGGGISLANIAPVNGLGTRLNPTLVSINRSLK
jgi:pilus assembly protein Flp/PilA